MRNTYDDQGGAGGGGYTGGTAYDKFFYGKDGNWYRYEELEAEFYQSDAAKKFVIDYFKYGNYPINTGIRGTIIGQWPDGRMFVYRDKIQFPDDRCRNCLDPSTIGKNLLGLSYPGGKNPRTYSKDYSYSYVPSDLSEYPAIGHDRRYDNIGTEGINGLLTDTRVIGADWQFVYEELSITSNSLYGIKSRINASLLGVGLGLLSLPKTFYKIGQPNGILEIIIWNKISNEGVTNTPSMHKHK